MYHINNFIIHF